MKKSIAILSALAGVLCLHTALEAQVVIPDTYRKDSSAADKSKPGFLWNVFQNAGNTANNNQRTEDALAGLLKDGEGNFLVNEADPAATGSADGPGVKLGTADNSPIQFAVSTVINFDQGAGSNGSITPDDQMPGIPGTSGSTDGIAGEVLTWLDLAEGEHTIVVNSDDGFTLSMGGASPKDAFATFVGQFNGGRGASDTSMTIKIAKAGLYATRVTWEEGGGGANIEFVQVKDGKKTAINGSDSSIKAYRAVTGSVATSATRVFPGPGSTAPFDASIEIDLENAAIAANSVKLTHDGAAVNATVTKTGSKVSVRYSPPGIAAPKSSHSIKLEFNDGTAQTREWTYTTVSYALLTAADKVAPDTSKPGFLWRVHQNQAFQANNNDRTEQQLAGTLGENLANPDAQGAAKGPGKKDPNSKLPIEFEIETVINLDQAGGGNGEFSPDDQMPGIPGTTESTDGIAAEILTFIELPAGTHTFIVNSDDGFRASAGNIKDIFLAQQAGEFNGGRGASDTSYRIVVKDPGVFPFRTTWEEGGGGANIEWKTVKADGTRVLINDTANGGFKAYRASTAGFPTAITSVTPAPGDSVVDPGTSVEAVITEGPTTVDVASVKLTVDGAAVAATVTKTGKVVTAKYKPAAPFAPQSKHTASITFTHGGATRSQEWSFAIPALTKDKVSGIAAFLTGAAKWSADAGGFTGKAGDYALDLGKGGSSALVRNVGFMNTAAADDTVSVSIWQNRYDVSNGNIFWFNAVTGGRGFQAHAPWGDGTIYFDTAGCCDGGSQRISSNISNYPTYSGDNSWWYQWRHYVFLKNGSNKQVWIDGVKFFEGENTNPLPTDFIDVVMGGGPNVTDNLNHAQLDDMAVYSGALSEADIKKLAGKAAPSSVPGLLAHWDFNDPIVAAATVSLSVVRNGANVSVTSTPATLPAGWVLQTATKVDGPWATQAGATTPFSAAIGNGTVFLRAIKP